MLDTLKVLVHMHTQLTADILANVWKVINNLLGKVVIKSKTDTYGEGTPHRAPVGRGFG